MIGFRPPSFFENVFAHNGPDQTELSPAETRTFLWSFLRLTLPSLALFAAVSYALYDVEKTAAEQVASAAERNTLQIATQVTRSELRGLRSDIQFLVQLSALRQWVTDTAPAERLLVEQDFLAFVEHQGAYDQVRYIDRSGVERVRVDWNGGTPQVKHEGDLQDKSHRYYVERALGLGAGEIYVSPFDLNLEEGEVELPRKPVIRISAPVVDSRTETDTKGVVVVNYLGDRLLNRLRAIRENETGAIWLLNADGYWLLGPDKEKEWGFMFPEHQGATFESVFQSHWNTIVSGPGEGQIVADGQLLSYARLEQNQSPLGEYAETWILVVAAPKSALISGRFFTSPLAIALGLVVVGLLIAISAILAQKKLARLRSNAEIRELNRRLTNRSKELELMNRELEAFSYSVAHDLRTPLRSIDGFSHTILNDYADKLDERGRDRLQRVRAGAQRMGVLIDGLLNLSRVSRTELRRKTIDITLMVNDLFDELRQSDPNRQVRIEVQSGLVARADDRLLPAALRNLVSNAWKFTRDATDPQIQLGKAANGGPFFIRDNGAGFDMEYADKLFGTFQRLHNETEFPGTGIGLAIVERVILKHDGAIWAESTVGEGATFYFTLQKESSDEPESNTIGGRQSR